MTRLVQNLVLQDLFAAKVQKLQCLDATKAYITGVLCEVKKDQKDYSQESLTLVFAEAKSTYQFERFQTLADWILLCKVMFPQSLNRASPDYYCALAQESYNRCYKILNKQWILFEELADRFPYFVGCLR